MSITKQLLESLAISSDEYQAILELLGRVPNELELGLFGSLRVSIRLSGSLSVSVSKC